MSLFAVQPRPLPKFPFLLAQGLLVALGAFLLFFTPRPLSAGILLAVLLAVLAGSGLALVPFLWRGRSASPSAVPRTLSPAPASPDPTDAERARWAELLEEIGALRVSVEARGAREAAGEERAGTPAPLAGESLAALGRDLEILRDEVEVLRSHQASRSFVEAGLFRQEEWLRRLEARQEEIHRLVRRLANGGGGPASVGGASVPDPATDSGSGEEVPGPAGIREERAWPEPPREPEEAAALTRLRVSAFLPPESRLCLRTEEGGLPLGEGLPLTRTGVGEWTWEGVLDDPLEGELLRNDTEPSHLGRVRLHPGDDLTLTPSFGGRDRPVQP